MPHRVSRDDGGLIRSHGPGVVVAIPVAEGDEVVEAGDVVAVIESMKMETLADRAVPRPRARGARPRQHAGRRAGAAAAARADRRRRRSPTGGERIRFDAPEPADGGRPGSTDLSGSARLRRSAPTRSQRVLAERRPTTGRRAPPARAVTPTCARSAARAAAWTTTRASSAQPAGAPARVPALARRRGRGPARPLRRARSAARARALRRRGLERTPALEDACYRLFLSQQPRRRARERRARDPRPPPPSAGAHGRRRRSAPCSTGSRPRPSGATRSLADLAREVRSRYYDEPVLAAARERTSTARPSAPRARWPRPDGRDREEHIAALVDCAAAARAAAPRAWPARRPRCARAARGDDAPLLPDPPARALRPRRRSSVTARSPATTARATTLAATFVDPDDLRRRPPRSRAGRAASRCRRGRGRRRLRAARRPAPAGDELAARLHAALATADAPGVRATASSCRARARSRPRLSAITRSRSGPASTGSRSDATLRGLHPMMAERLRLWRLSRVRARAAAVGRGRLPVPRRRAREPEGRAAVRARRGARPHAGARRARPRHRAARARAHAASARSRRCGAFQAHRRPARAPAVEPRAALRLADDRARPREASAVIDRARPRRPPGSASRWCWSTAACASPTAGAPSACCASSPRPAAASSSSSTTRRRTPLQPLDEGAQRIVAARRRGLVHPAEIVKLLAPPRGRRLAAGQPAGEFVEHDLDDDGRLVPVDRPPATNTGGIVVGLIRNRTERHPEGMLRVVLLGDPTHALGSLAEPECRADHRRARPRRGARRAGRVVRALVRRADRDGHRHREHGLGRGGAAPDRRVHAGRRRDQRRRHRHQRRRAAVLERRGDDADAHAGASS